MKQGRVSRLSKSHDLKGHGALRYSNTDFPKHLKEKKKEKAKKVASSKQGHGTNIISPLASLPFPCITMSIFFMKNWIHVVDGQTVKMKGGIRMTIIEKKICIYVSFLSLILEIENPITCLVRAKALSVSSSGCRLGGFICTIESLSLMLQFPYYGIYLPHFL